MLLDVGNACWGMAMQTAVSAVRPNYYTGWKSGYKLCAVRQTHVVDRVGRVAINTHGRYEFCESPVFVCVPTCTLCAKGYQTPTLRQLYKLGWHIATDWLWLFTSRNIMTALDHAGRFICLFWLSGNDCEHISDGWTGSPMRTNTPAT